MWHALLGMDVVITGGAIPSLVCNMAILRLHGSHKVVIFALEGAMAFATPTRLPLLHKDQPSQKENAVQPGATHLVY